MPGSLATLILAAGKGERMKSPKPKVLHELGEKPLVGYPLELSTKLGISKKVVVVGYRAREVQETIRERYPHLKGTSYALQRLQKGTAHAVLSAESHFKNFGGNLLILYGDVPLLRVETIERLIHEYHKRKASIAILTTFCENPTGYGRIIRNGMGDVLRIVEEKDATLDERQVKEINTGVILTQAPLLFSTLKEIRQNRKTGEYYLTDIVKHYLALNHSIATTRAYDPQEVQGINNPFELLKAESVLRQRLIEKWTETGVYFTDPASTFVGPQVKIGVGTRIEPHCHLRGNTSIGKDCRIDSACVITNSKIGDLSLLKPHCVITESRISRKAVIGPFAHLRPGTDLAEGVHIGNFVETKKSRIGQGSKANHLTYIGDAVIGQGVNVGAGTITCNYDGKTKHKTIIGDKVFVGSDTQFVAPVKIGAGALIAAGTTVTKNVPARSLAIARVKQTNIKNWKKKH